MTRTTTRRRCLRLLPHGSGGRGYRLHDQLAGRLPLPQPPLTDSSRFRAVCSLPLPTKHPAVLSRNARMGILLITAAGNIYLFSM